MVNSKYVINKFASYFFLFALKIYKSEWTCFLLVEYRGHRLLEGARQGDVSLIKKHLSSDIVNFKHPFTSDSALVNE